MCDAERKRWEMLDWNRISQIGHPFQILSESFLFRRREVLLALSPCLLWSALHGHDATRWRRRPRHIWLGHGMYEAKILASRPRALDWLGPYQLPVVMVIWKGNESERNGPGAI